MEWGGGGREVEELPAELDVELEREEEEEGEEKEDGGRLAVSFLEPGGELQREPRGETETPESQLSFRLRLPPPRPGANNIVTIWSKLSASESSPGEGLCAGDFSALNLW